MGGEWGFLPLHAVTEEEDIVAGSSVSWDAGQLVPTNCGTLEQSQINS